MSLRSLAAAVFLAAASLMQGAERYYAPPLKMKAGTVLTDSVTAGCVQWTFHCRVEPPRTAHNPRWRIRLGDSLTLSLERKGLKATASDYDPSLEIVLKGPAAEKNFILDRGFDPTADGWSVVVEKTAGSDSIMCRIGQRSTMLDFMVADFGSPAEISLEAGTDIGLSRMSLICEPPAECGKVAFETADSLESYLSASVDPLECHWRYLDRDTDQRLLNLGGDYRLATVSRGDGGYDIVYLGGARVNSSFWKPLMIKGRLMPTRFAGHFDLVWYDAYGKPVDIATNATIESEAIMRLDFPLQGGTVRFAALRR